MNTSTDASCARLNLGDLENLDDKLFRLTFTFDVVENRPVH